MVGGWRSGCVRAPALRRCRGAGRCHVPIELRDGRVALGRGVGARAGGRLGRASATHSRRRGVLLGGAPGPLPGNAPQGHPSHSRTRRASFAPARRANDLPRRTWGTRQTPRMPPPMKPSASASFSLIGMRAITPAIRYAPRAAAPLGRRRGAGAGTGAGVALQLFHSYPSPAIELGEMPASGADRGADEQPGLLFCQCAICCKLVVVHLSRSINGLATPCRAHKSSFFAPTAHAPRSSNGDAATVTRHAHWLACILSCVVTRCLQLLR